MNTTLNVLENGVVGDGSLDNTQKLQSLMDELSESGGGTLYFPTGKYRVNRLFVRPHVTLLADAAWPYGPSSVAVLLPVSDAQRCVLDVSHANGATICGMCIDGEGRGENMCGILMDKDSFGPREDCFRIEKCKVANFSSHAVFLDKIWCFSVRSCMFAHSGGDGLRIHGWDAFVLDNWFSGNRGAGFGTEGGNCSVTMTGNRIEWNSRGGIVIEGGSHYNITGNYIDRSGDAGIAILPSTNDDGSLAISHTITMTGNIVYRSGKTAPDDSLRSAQVILDRAANSTFVGNSLCLGRDDGAKGHISPSNGMVLRGLYNCVVAGNTLMACATEHVINDLGAHDAGTVIRDNPGSIIPVTGKSDEDLAGFNASNIWKDSDWMAAAKQMPTML